MDLMTAKKTIYVHIGTHKTATSYLQKIMSVNKDNLINNKIDYYGKCTQSRAYTGDTIDEKLFEYLDNFRNNGICESLIISDEDLCHNTDNVCLNFIRRYSDLFDIKVICYIREIVSYYSSFYSYASVYLCNTNNIPEFTNLIEYSDLQKAYVSTYNLLEDLTEFLELTDIVVRPFGKQYFRDGKIENDFFDIVGCDPNILEPITVQNVSPSLKQAEKIYYALNLTKAPLIRRSVANKILESYEDNDNQSTISMDELDAIYDKYHFYEENLLNKFLLNNVKEDVFKDSYSKWKKKIEENDSRRFLDQNEKDEVMDLVRKAKLMSILKSPLYFSDRLKKMFK